MSTTITERTDLTETTETGPVRALLAAVAVLVTAGAASYAVPVAFSALYTALGREETLLLTTVGGVVMTLFLGLIAFAYLRVRDIDVPVRWPAGREWAWIAGGVVVSLVAAVAFAILEGIFAVEAAPSSSSTVAAEASALTVVVAAAYFLLVVGPIEEYLYRGVVQGRLRQNFGPAVAIGVTSIGFAVGHVPNFLLAGTGALSVGIAVAVAGIVAGSVILGIIYERTANLTVVALVHGVTNAVLFALVVALSA